MKQSLLIMLFAGVVLTGCAVKEKPPVRDRFWDGYNAGYAVRQSEAEFEAELNKDNDPVDSYHRGYEDAKWDLGK